MGRPDPPRSISPNTLVFLSNFLPANCSRFISRPIIRCYIVLTLIASLNNQLKKETSIVDTDALCCGVWRAATRVGKCTGPSVLRRV
jgi:hypothetical protein